MPLVAGSRKDRESLEFTAPSRCKLNALYELHHLLTSPVVYLWGGEAGNDFFLSLGSTSGGNSSVHFNGLQPRE